MSAVAVKRSRPTRHPSASMVGARQAPYPGFIVFCDPTLRQHAPAGTEWVHETKLDGYRAQVHLHDGKVRVYSREGLNWTKQFSDVAAAAKHLPAWQAIIDGEAVVPGKNGIPDFQALRRELDKGSGQVIYQAFDLLYLDGMDLRGAALLDRKHALQKLLAEAPPNIEYLGHFEEDGPTLYRHACALHLEGIVSKRSDSVYRSGRQESWIKVKCVKTDTFPIVAFVEKLGAKPRKVASLYVGRRIGGKLLYAGKARSGYTEEIARELR